MLGADVAAEMQSPDCPWLDEHPEAVLEANRKANDQQIDRLIELANDYRDEVFSVSVGNEATVEWSDHQVPVERLIEFVKRIKQTVVQPVTFCENYVPWVGKLEPLAAELDFISVHSYPVWEYQTIDSALQYTQQNYQSVATHYPDMPIVITEAGWTTRSNGRGIDGWNATQEFQAHYYRQLMEWSRSNQILTFFGRGYERGFQNRYLKLKVLKFINGHKPVPAESACLARAAQQS